MNTFYKMMATLHVALFRLTGGRIGGSIAGRNILLLTTIGRKSGKQRTTPVVYLRDGEHYLIAASNNGADRHSGWYWNATKGQHPVRIQVGDQTMTVAVAEAEGEQREALYSRFSSSMANFAGYEKKTSRVIPVLILTPQD